MYSKWSCNFPKCRFSYCFIHLIFDIVQTLFQFYAVCKCIIYSVLSYKHLWNWGWICLVGFLNSTYWISILIFPHYISFACPFYNILFAFSLWNFINTKSFITFRWLLILIGFQIYIVLCNFRLYLFIRFHLSYFLMKLFTEIL